MAAEMGLQVSAVCSEVGPNATEGPQVPKTNKKNT